MNLINKIAASKQIFGCLDAVIPLVINQLANETGPIIFIARDDARMSRIEAGLHRFSDQIECLSLPAWDCLPYDRVSAHSTITAKRIQTLSHLSVLIQTDHQKPFIVLTTVNGWLQKLPPMSFFTSSCLRLRAGQSITQNEIASFLARNGFRRTQTVREYGEFSIRGGIVDIYPDTDAFAGPA